MKRKIIHGDGNMMMRGKKVYEILNSKLANEIESSINRCVFDVQEKSFIAGFAYACKCLSNGKIEFGGGMKNE